MKRIAISILTGLLCSLSVLHAQQVDGLVQDSAQTPLPGASVVWLGTTYGTMTDQDGHFVLDRPGAGGSYLVVSYVGYRTDTVKVGDTAIIVTLQPGTGLEEVEITGKKAGAHISGIEPAKTEVITQKELAKAACCDLSGCFETQTTVRPQTTNVLTNSKELRIHGLAGVYNQILFDGLPFIQGPAYTYGISAWPGTMVDNIYVSQGANSVLQGFESINGQLNITPKMPDNAEKLLLNVYANSFMETQYNVNVTSEVGEDWQTSLSLHSAQPGQRIDRDKDNFLDLPLLTRYMGYNKWKYRDDVHQGLSFEAGARMLHEERVGGQTGFFPDQHGGSQDVYGQHVRFTQPEGYHKTSYRFNAHTALSLRSSAFHHRQNTWFGTVRYDAQQTYMYHKLELEQGWGGNHVLQAGGSYRYQQLTEDIAFTDTLLPRSYDGTYQTPQRIPGVFAENTFNWWEERITLVTGLRLDHHQQFGAFFTPRGLLKIQLHDNHDLRASAGTGWRQVNLFSEHINLLASSRDIRFEETLRPEEAMNMGINYTWRFSYEDMEGTLTTDLYQTRFMNQFFPDYDRHPERAYIYNFTEKSVSNAAQAELLLKWKGLLELRLGYNYVDVYRMKNGQKEVLPFNPVHRGIMAASYRSANDRWSFDVNMHAYGKQRLPDTRKNPEEYRVAEYSKPYSIWNAQVTHRWKRWSFYMGCENVFDFRLIRPIVSWQEPFSPYFDTSFIWGPTRGREVYAGIRYRIK